MIATGKIASHQARIYLDKYDLSGVLNSGELGVDQEAPVVTCFADVGPRVVVANYMHHARFGGFYDAVTAPGISTNIDALLDSLKDDGQDHYLTNLIEGNAEGTVAYDSVVKCDGEPRKFAIGQAVALEGAFIGSNHLTRGLVLASVGVNAVGTRPGRNQGLTVAGQIYGAVLRVLSGTFVALTVRVEESSDNGSADAYTAIPGFTLSPAIPNTGSVVRVTTAAATKAWKRVNISSFSGSSAVILVTGGTVAGSVAPVA